MILSSSPCRVLIIEGFPLVTALARMVILEGIKGGTYGRFPISGGR